MIGDCSLHVGYAGLDDHKGQLSLTSQPWVTHRSELSQCGSSKLKWT